MTNEWKRRLEQTYPRASINGINQTGKFHFKISGWSCKIAISMLSWPFLYSSVLWQRCHDAKTNPTWTDLFLERLCVYSHHEQYGLKARRARNSSWAAHTPQVQQREEKDEEQSCGHRHIGRQVENEEVTTKITERRKWWGLINDWIVKEKCLTRTSSIYIHTYSRGPSGGVWASWLSDRLRNERCSGRLKKDNKRWGEMRKELPAAVFYRVRGTKTKKRRLTQRLVKLGHLGMIPACCLGLVTGWDKKRGTVFRWS